MITKITEQTALKLCQQYFPNLIWEDSAPTAVNQVIIGTHPQLWLIVEARLFQRESLDNAMVCIRIPRVVVIVETPNEFGIGLEEALQIAREKWDDIVILMSVDKIEKSED